MSQNFSPLFYWLVSSCSLVHVALLPSNVNYLHLLKSHPTWIRTCYRTCTSFTRSLIIGYSNCHLICLCFQPACQDHHSSKAMSSYFVNQWCEFILEGKLKCLQQMLKFHRYRIVSWYVMAPGYHTLLLSCCVPPHPLLLDMCFLLALVHEIYDSCWKHIWLAHLYSSLLKKITQSGSPFGPKATWQITMSQARWEEKMNSTIKLSNAWKMLALR